MVVILTIMIYLAQMTIACLFNAFNSTRIPKTFNEVILFTFLPYVIIYRNKINT